MRRVISIASAIVLSAWVEHQASAIEPTDFETHTVDAAFEGGYQVTVADIDSDGNPDIIALATSPSQLVWYKNPTWEPHVITTRTERNIDLAPYDIDGDGDTDLALAYEFSLGSSTEGGSVAWLECPDDPAAPEEWPVHLIYAVPTSHRLRWVQLEYRGGPGLWLLNLPIIGVGAQAPTYEGPLQFMGYAMTLNVVPPIHPRESMAWGKTTFDDTLELAHGMRVVQWDDDRSDEVLTASAAGIHLFDFVPTKQSFNRRHLTPGHQGDRPKTGASEVALGHFASVNRYIAAIEPWHGNEVVVYPLDDNGDVTQRIVIDDTIEDGHALACIDLDNDGIDEIAAGGRGGDRALRVSQYTAETGTWNRSLLDPGNMGAAGIFVADIDNDGDDDIVAIGTATQNVVWYENLREDR